MTFQLSADTRFLMQKLRSLQIGDTITYKDLATEIGKPVTGALPALASARRILLRDENMVFDIVRGDGLKRLNDVEIVGTSHRTAKKIKRAAQRGVRTLTAVADFSALPREAQMRHTAAVSVFGVIAEFTKEPNIARVEKIADGKKGELPIAATLDAFRSK
jgi:hypothetical protein